MLPPGVILEDGDRAELCGITPLLRKVDDLRVGN